MKFALPFFLALLLSFGALSHSMDYAWDAQAKHLWIHRHYFENKHTAFDLNQLRDVIGRFENFEGSFDQVSIYGSNEEISHLLEQLSGREIKTLELSGHSYGSKRAVFDNIIGLIAGQFPTLEALLILNSEDNFPLTSNHLKALSNLKLIRLQGDFEIIPGNRVVGESNQLIEEIAHFKDSLEELSLGKETWVTSNAAVTTLASLTKLKKLTIRAPIGQETIDVINGLNLTHLNLADAFRTRYSQVLSILEQQRTHLRVFAFHMSPVMERSDLSEERFNERLKNFVTWARSKQDWTLQAVGYFPFSVDDAQRTATIFEEAGVKRFARPSDYDAKWKNLWDDVADTRSAPAVVKTEAAKNDAVYTSWSHAKTLFEGAIILFLVPVMHYLLAE